MSNRLPNEIMRCVSIYVNARFSHKDDRFRKIRKRDIIRKLKKEPPEVMQEWAIKVQDLLKRSGIDDSRIKQHQGGVSS